MHQLTSWRNLIVVFLSNLRGVLHERLLTTHMEESRKKEHLREVTQRQQLAEQQIAKLEAELAEEQKKKEDLVRHSLFISIIMCM